MNSSGSLLPHCLQKHAKSVSLPVPRCQRGFRAASCSLQDARQVFVRAGAGAPVAVLGDASRCSAAAVVCVSSQSQRQQAVAAGGAELWGRGRGLGDGGGGRGRARGEVPGALQRLKAIKKNQRSVHGCPALQRGSPLVAPRSSSRASRGRAVLAAALHFPSSLEEAFDSAQFSPSPPASHFLGLFHGSLQHTRDARHLAASCRVQGLLHLTGSQLRTSDSSSLCSLCSVPQMPKQGTLAPRRMSSAATSLWLPMHASHAARHCCAASTICQP